MSAKKYTFLDFLKSLFTINFYRPKHLAKFFDDKGKTKEEFFFDVLLIILVLISSFFYILETYPLSATVFAIIKTLDVLVMIFFSIELFARLKVNKDNKKYWYSFFNIADMLAVIPFWLSLVIPGFGSLQFLRVFRLFKIFRYFDKYFNRKRIQRKVITRVLIMKIAFTLFVLLYVSAGLFFTFEAGKNPQITTFDDAIYFSLVTVTTVGFGDITPVTKTGQVIVMFIILAGIFSIPVYMSTLLQAHIGQINKKTVVCETCGLQYHDQNASHCKNCGTALSG